MLIDTVACSPYSVDSVRKDALKAITEGLQWEENDIKNLTLFSDGCRVTYETTNDCTAACLDPNYAFANMFTFANCIAYPWISQSISNGNLTTRGQAIANQFNILSNTSYPGIITAIAQVQNKCWNQWITHADFSLFSPDSPDWSDLCGGDYGNIGAVNSDIGGIGVMFIKALLFHEINRHYIDLSILLDAK